MIRGEDCGRIRILLNDKHDYEGVTIENIREVLEILDETNQPMLMGALWTKFGEAESAKAEYDDLDGKYDDFLEIYLIEAILATLPLRELSA